jgi:hypothetical protein
MVVISRSKNHSYCLGELDGSVTIRGYAGYRLIPYYARDPVHIPVTHVFREEDLQKIAEEVPEHTEHIPDDDELNEHVPCR